MIEKKANCPVAFVGGTITYCVTVTNSSNYEFPATFIDVLDTSLTFIAGTFTVDGIPQTPTISDQEIRYAFTIPANDNVIICFKVRVN